MNKKQKKYLIELIKHDLEQNELLDLDISKKEIEELLNIIEETKILRRMNKEETQKYLEVTEILNKTQEQTKNKLNKLNIQRLREEFEQLIKDDEYFKEDWANEKGDYTESSFYEWFQDVIETSNFEDILKFCE